MGEFCGESIGTQEGERGFQAVEEEELGLAGSQGCVAISVQSKLGDAPGPADDLQTRLVMIHFWEHTLSIKLNIFLGSRGFRSL